MECDTLGAVKLTQILHIIDVVRRHSRGKADDDIDVTMEFLVGSLFPELYQNFNAKIVSEYHRGFTDGFNCSKEFEKEENDETT